MNKKEVDFKKIKIVITAGGSGGHVTVALAVMQNLYERGISRDEILFIGGDLNKGGDTKTGSVEQKMTEQIDSPKLFIRAGKLQRKFQISSILLAMRSLLSLWDTLRIFLKIKPKIVISFGGYVSLPVGVVAKLFNRTIILHEQTAAVGLANKIVSLFSDKILVNFESAKKYFRSKTVIHTGNPLRSIIFEKQKPSTDLSGQIHKNFLNKKNKPFIYITGGGQGSQLFNDLVLNNIIQLTNQYNILLQSGSYRYSQLRRRFNRLSKTMPAKNKNSIILTDFVQEEIGYVLQNADVVVSRGGAGTISELGALQKKSVIIPIKWVTHNEQFKNAKILSDIGLAIILDEDNININDFVNAIDTVLKKENPPQDLAKRIFKQNAAQEIGDLVLKYLSLNT